MGQRLLHCMLRYTNHAMQGDLELAPASTSCSMEDVSWSSLVVDGFNQRLLALLEVLRVEAAAGGDGLKFAVGNATVSIYSNNISTIYGLLQCSPDLKELDCDNCLEEGFGNIQVNCYGRDFARYGNPSCNIRFEVDNLFFDPAAQTVPVALPPLPSPSPNSGGMYLCIYASLINSKVINNIYL